MKTEKAETKTVTGSGIFMNSSLRLKSNKKPGRKSSFLSASVLLDNVLKTTQKTKLTLDKGVNGSATVLRSLQHSTIYNGTDNSATRCPFSKPIKL